MSRKLKRRPLPPACSLCRPYGGLWRNYGTAGLPVLKRCECERGVSLSMGLAWHRKGSKKAKGAANDGKAAAAGEAE